MSYNRPVKFELGDVEVKIVLKKVGNSDEIAAQYIDLKNGATIEKYSAQFSTLFEHSSVYMDSEIQKINLKVKK